MTPAKKCMKCGKTMTEAKNCKVKNCPMKMEAKKSSSKKY